MSNINELIKKEVLTLFTKMKKRDVIQIIQYKLNSLGTNMKIYNVHFKIKFEINSGSIHIMFKN